MYCIWANFWIQKRDDRNSDLRILRMRSLGFLEMPSARLRQVFAAFAGRSVFPNQYPTGSSLLGRMNPETCWCTRSFWRPRTPFCCRYLSPSLLASPSSIQVIWYVSCFVFSWDSCACSPIEGQNLGILIHQNLECAVLGALYNFGYFHIYI